MTWTYKQSTGDLADPNGDYAGTGYSGAAIARNDGAEQSVPNVGPIPVGRYTIGPSYNEVPGLGPCVMHLDPTPETNTFGRSAFRIHGDNVNHDASHGCVILGPSIRHLIAASEDRMLDVIA